MTRHFITLAGPVSRLQAKVGVDRAPDGYVLELHEPGRSVEQNSALHGLITQIKRQRPTHFGVCMTVESYKAMFMHALGHEGVFVPTLDGTGMFPMGQRTSKLTKTEFSGLLELILAWTAREGLTVEHFDTDAATPPQVGVGAGSPPQPLRPAAPQPFRSQGGGRAMPASEAAA